MAMRPEQLGRRIGRAVHDAPRLITPDQVDAAGREAESSMSALMDIMEESAAILEPYFVKVGEKGADGVDRRVLILIGSVVTRDERMDMVAITKGGIRSVIERGRYTYGRTTERKIQSVASGEATLEINDENSLTYSNKTGTQYGTLWLETIPLRREYILDIADSAIENSLSVLREEQERMQEELDGVRAISYIADALEGRILGRSLLDTE